MSKRSLRLFPSPSSDRQERELDQICGVNDPKSVAVPLSTIAPLLVRAAENNHTWLEDFADDTVQIDSDLYEILMAFQNLQLESPQTPPRSITTAA